MQDKIKIVSWNAVGGDDYSITQLLGNAQAKKVDVVFLQNVDQNVATRLKSAQGYTLLSCLYVSPSQRNTTAYVVYYNAERVEASDRGYFPVPAQPANADQFQEARICRNAFSHVQLATKGDPNQKEELSKIQTQLQNAQIKLAAAQSNVDLAQAIEDYMIAVLAVNGNATPSQQESLKSTLHRMNTNYTYAQHKLGQEAEIENTQRGAQKQNASPQEDQGNLNTLKQLLTDTKTKIGQSGSVDNGFQGNLTQGMGKVKNPDLKTTLQKVMDTTAKGKNLTKDPDKTAATNAIDAALTAIVKVIQGQPSTQASVNQALFTQLETSYKAAQDATKISQDTLGTVSKLRPQAQKNHQNAKAALVAVQKEAESQPKPLNKQLAVFNWAAPIDSNARDGQYLGSYAFRRALKFFQNPNGSLRPGSGLIVLGAFNITTEEMGNIGQQLTENMVSGDTFFDGGGSRNHMINFNLGIGDLVKDDTFEAYDVYGGDTPLCADFKC